MNKAVLVLLAISVGLAAASWQLVRELHGERENVQRLQARIAQLEHAARQRAAESSAPSASSVSAPDPASMDRTASQADAAAARASAVARKEPANTAASAGRADRREERMRAIRQRQRALLRDPEYREALLAQQRAMLPSMYPDLAPELGLSADDMERLMTLLAEHQVRQMDAHSLRFEDPTDPQSMQEMQRISESLQKSLDQDIRTLLGDEKWRAWQDYQSTIGVRHEVAQLGTLLAGKSAALSDDQVKPLRQALARVQQELMREWSASRPRNAESRNVVEELDASLTRLRAHHARVLDEVRPILTPTQLQDYVEHQETQLQLQEAQLRLMRAQAAGQEMDVVVAFPGGVVEGIAGGTIVSAAPDAQ